MERKLYDANLRMLEVELEMAGFPDEVTWDLRKEMPWSFREQFRVAFETYGCGRFLSGVLFFEQMRVNDMYRFAAFEITRTEFPDERDMTCRIERVEGLSVGLREAVNLMQGRPVYLDYHCDPQGQGYWVELVQQDEMLWVVSRAQSEFLVETALETGLFRRRLGAEACFDLARALEKGDRAPVVVNGKTVFVQVDLSHERLILTDAAGRPARLNWWEMFMGRR